MKRMRLQAEIRSEWKTLQGEFSDYAKKSIAS